MTSRASDLDAIGAFDGQWLDKIHDTASGKPWNSTWNAVETEAWNVVAQIAWEVYTIQGPSNAVMVALNTTMGAER